MHMKHSCVLTGTCLHLYTVHSDFFFLKQLLLLYVDDVVFLSKRLTICECCQRWNLTANPNKRKVII